MVDNTVVQPHIERYIVRPAMPTDIPAMSVMLGELFSIESDFMPDRARQSTALRMMLKKPFECCVHVACEGENVVGMCTAQLCVSTAEGGVAARLEDVIVLRPYRCRGIATMLLSETARWARARGARRLQLNADIDNTPALTFYHNRGWHRTRLICLSRYCD